MIRKLEAITESQNPPNSQNAWDRKGPLEIIWSFKVNGKTRYSKSGDCEIFIIVPHSDHTKFADRHNIF